MRLDFLDFLISLRPRFVNLLLDHVLDELGAVRDGLELLHGLR